MRKHAIVPNYCIITNTLLCAWRAPTTLQNVQFRLSTDSHMRFPKDTILDTFSHLNKTRAYFSTRPGLVLLQLEARYFGYNRLRLQCGWYHHRTDPSEH